MKVAVWGLGQHAIRNILPALNQSRNLSLHGVFSRDKKIVNKCAKDFQCTSWSTLEDMLGDAELEAIYVSTPPGLHYDQGIKVLSANKHFWCEKPFTTDLVDSQKIIDLSIKKKLSVCEALMYLYHPQFTKLKELIDKKALGAIKKVNCRFTLPKLDNPGYRFDASLGGSALLDVGTYPLSAILNLFPKSKIKIVNSALIQDQTNAIDSAGKIELSIDKKINCSLEWAYNKNYRNEIKIWGERGSLFAERIFSKQAEYAPSIILKNSKGSKTKIEIMPANHFSLMLESFSDSTCHEDKLNHHREAILNLIKFIHDIKESISNIHN